MLSHATRQRMPGSLLRRLLASAAASVWLLSCSAPLQVEYERGLEQTDAQARHALHDARLRELMRSIQRLSEDRLPKSLDVEGPLRFQAQEVAQIARALSESAIRIPEASNEARMSATDRAEFDALARQLQQRAAALARAADALRADEARTQLEAIQQTCQGCHVRFRPLASP